jgi:selenocysteine lyase/cysteine desulfurase
VTPSYKRHFTRALAADPARLHFAAHSHHLWPDVSRDAQIQAWDDAVRLADRKWGAVFDDVLGRAREHTARLLGLAAPDSITYAANTHELVVRILSCLDPHRPPRILTTTSEFHSWNRQLRRLEEDGLVAVTRLDVEPFDSFEDRFVRAASDGPPDGDRFDLVYVSHVFFDSGYVVGDLARVAEALPRETFLVVDGYHAFMALPVDLSPIAHRTFYLTGGYKYAMSGEAVCFAHCPPGYGERPRATGWFAGFTSLRAGVADRVPYSEDGLRFMGATFDPTPVYRFNSVMDLWRSEGVTVADIHAHVGMLQQRFLDGIAAGPAGPVDVGNLMPSRGIPDRGHFLTFRHPGVQGVFDLLLRDNVITDVRGDRLRFGFGLYHDPDDVDHLLDRLRSILR